MARKIKQSIRAAEFFNKTFPVGSNVQYINFADKSETTVQVRSPAFVAATPNGSETQVLFLCHTPIGVFYGNIYNVKYPPETPNKQIFENLL